RVRKLDLAELIELLAGRLAEGAARRRERNGDQRRRDADTRFHLVTLPIQNYPPSPSSTAQLRRGSATPIAMNTPPQAWLKRRPARRSHGLMRCAMLAMNTSVTISMAAKVAAMMANWTKRLRAGSMN